MPNSRKKWFFQKLINLLLKITQHIFKPLVLTPEKRSRKIQIPNSSTFLIAVPEITRGLPQFGLNYPCFLLSKTFLYADSFYKSLLAEMSRQDASLLEYWKGLLTDSFVVCDCLLLAVLCHPRSYLFYYGNITPH